MPASRFNLLPPPPGFRFVSAELDLPSGPALTEGYIPDEERYPTEAVRLSTKATHGEAFTDPFWDDVLNTVLKGRDKYFGIGPIDFTIREVHDATESPDRSLLQIHVISTLPQHQFGSEVAYAMRYLMYFPDSDTLKDYKFEHLGSDPNVDDMQEAGDLTDMVGEAETGDKERLFFYGALCIGAGEGIPQSQS